MTTTWTGQPAYRQVADEMRRRIHGGPLVAGARLPSIAEMMREFGVSITVVRMALAELRADGLITTHQGKGAFVTEGEPPAKNELDELRAEVRRLAERVAKLEVK